jgi:hypothetical protein
MHGQREHLKKKFSPWNEKGNCPTRRPISRWEKKGGREEGRQHKWKG